MNATESENVSMGPQGWDRGWVAAFLDFPADMACEKYLEYEGAGINVFITANSSKPFMLGWYGGDRYDYREYAGEIKKLVRRDKNIRLILQVGTFPGSAPLRWCEEHLDQLAHHANGTVLNAPSLASEVWRSESSEAIRRLVADFEAGEFASNIVGYIPVCNGLEWGGIGESASELPAHEMDVSRSQGDFSQPMVDGFRTFLRGRYPDAGALQSAWRDCTVDFENALPVDILMRQHIDHGSVFLDREKWGSRFSDYFEFYNSLNVELALSWCRAVKAGSGGKKLAGLFHGLLYGMPNAVASPQASGHIFARRIYDAPEVDFVGSRFSYTHRGIQGAHLSEHPIDSVLLRNKSFLDIVESGTHARRKAHQEIALMMGGHIENTGKERWDAADPWQTVQILNRDAAPGLAKNGVHTAWMDVRMPPHGHWFTHHPWGPLAYDTPEIRAHLQRLNDARKDSGGPDRFPAEIAVFSSSESALYRAFERKYGNFFVEGFRHWTMPFIGAHADEYLLEDWEAVLRTGRRYKLYIFLDALFVSAAMRSAIRSRIEEGAHALWFYAPGFLDETGASVSRCEDLTGIMLACDERSRNHLVVNAVNGSFAPFGSKVDAAAMTRKTGEAVWPPDGLFSPVFYAADARAQTLGMLEGTGQAGLVTKEVGKGRSIYCAAPMPPASLISSFCREAGVHLFSQDGDVIVSGGNTFAVTCVSGGARKITLGRRIGLSRIDAEGGRFETDTILFEAKRGETRIYRVD